jgi:hypothetical protein
MPVPFLKHDPARQLAGVGQTDGRYIGNLKPARTAMESINAFPSRVAGGLHRYRQTFLDQIPNHKGPVLRLQIGLGDVA